MLRFVILVTAISLYLSPANADSTARFGHVAHASAMDSLIANFVVSCQDLVCSFADASQGTPTRFRWDLGDGTNIQVAEFDHAYSSGGTYTVLHGVSDEAGAKVFVERDITVGVGLQPPTAGFSYTNDVLIVSFVDESTDVDGTITEWEWDFGDGTTSTEQSPTHIYSESSSYTVSLTVTDNDGQSNQLDRVVTVSTSALAPSADFDYTVFDLAVEFTDLSVDADAAITAWSWDFGDGQTSALQHPNHEYSIRGTYQVSLEVTDAQGLTAAASKTIDLSVPVNTKEPTALLSHFEVYPNPVSDVVNIELNLFLAGESVVSLYDVAGRVLDRWVIASGPLSSVTRRRVDLAKGVYFVVLRSSGGTETVSIVKR